jgi:hypothetical protein
MQGMEPWLWRRAELSKPGWRISGSSVCVLVCMMDVGSGGGRWVSRGRWDCTTGNQLACLGQVFFGGSSGLDVQIRQLTRLLEDDATPATFRVSCRAGTGQSDSLLPRYTFWKRGWWDGICA